MATPSTRSDEARGAGALCSRESGLELAADVQRQPDGSEGDDDFEQAAHEVRSEALDHSRLPGLGSPRRPGDPVIPSRTEPRGRSVRESRELRLAVERRCAQLTGGRLEVL